MQLTLTQIGNSKVIPLSQEILEQCKITNDVELQILGNTIVLKPAHSSVRRGWEESFQAMHNNGDDKLLVDDSIHPESFVWEW